MCLSDTLAITKGSYGNYKKQHLNIQEEAVDVTRAGSGVMEAIDGALPVESSVEPGLLRMEAGERLAPELLRLIASKNALQ